MTMKGCIYCQVMIKYLKLIVDQVTVVDIDNFVNDHISDILKDKFLEKVKSEGITMPYAMYNKNGEWKQLDMSVHIKTHISRYGEKLKSVSK